MDGQDGERRLVTVLFADLAGSTELSQSLDPEDYADLVDDYHRSGRGAIESKGGTVLKFLGDGIVAYFGHPVSRADDAARAVDAGLLLCEYMAARPDANVRVGIHAGVTILSPDPTGNLDLVGLTANVAARIEGAAETNSVAVSAPVAELLRDAFTLADPRYPSLKGVDEPIEVFTVVGRAEQRPHRISLVLGREEELERAASAWQRATTGTGQMLVLLGEAGAGKSTLFGEVLRRIELVGGPVVSAAASDLGGSQPFHVLARIVQRVVALGGVARPDPASPLGAVLSGSPPPMGGGGFVEVMDAATEILRGCGPLVVGVEDLHWADPSSITWLGRLVDELPDMSTLVVATSREKPGLRADTIELGPLHVDEIRTIATTAGPTLEATVIDDILARAGHIPLYVAELARAAEFGSDPVNVHSSLLEAFDRAGESKDFARLAAALGEHPDLEVLRALDPDADRHSASLIEAGVLVGRPPGIAFRHALIRDEIYGTYLRAHRRVTHARLAAELGRRGAAAAVLAHHHGEAADHLPAARHYASAAADAAARGASVEAVALSQRGIDAVTVAGDDRSEVAPLELRLTMTLGNALLAVDGYGSLSLLDVWERCVELAAEVGDRDEQSSGMNGRSLHAFFSGDLTTAIERGNQILAFGVEHDNRLARLRAHCSIGLGELHAGRAAVALDHANQAIAQYRDGDYVAATYGFGTDHLVIARMAAGQSQWLMGDLVAAADQFQLARHHAEALGSHISLALALMQRIFALLVNGESHAAIGPSEQLAAHAARYDMPFYVGLSRLFLASVEGLDGQSGSTDKIIGALGEVSEGGNAVGAPLVGQVLAACFARQGDVEATVATVDGMLAGSAVNGEHFMDADLHLLAASVLQGQERLARLAEARTVAARLGLHWPHLRAVEAWRDTVPSVELDNELADLAPLITSRLIAPNHVLESR